MSKFDKMVEAEDRMLCHTARVLDIIQGAMASPRSTRNYWAPPAVELAEAALQQGPMVRMDGRYHTGKRSFRIETIEALIGRGIAIRVGTGVVHVDHARS